MDYPVFIPWEPEPDILGYASGFAVGGDLLTEATVTLPDPGPVGPSSYDVLGRDGVTVVEHGLAASPEEAMAAAERGMRRLLIRIV